MYSLIVILTRVTTLLLATALLLGIFSYSSAMVQLSHRVGDGSVHHVCPVVGTTLGCVSLLEHLTHWHLAFAATLVEALTLVVLLLVFCSWRSCFGRRNTSPINRNTLPSMRIRSLLPRHALAEALSNGRIQPKLFYNGVL